MSLRQTNLNENEYYDEILEKYKLFSEGKLYESKDLVTAKELIKIMQELKNTPKNEFQTRDLMENITRNTLILLLSLIEQHDETTEYKDYIDLTDNEKTILKAQYSSIFP